MADNISSNTTNVSTTNANTNNLSNKPQDNDKYTAKRNDGKKNTQNQNVKGKSSSSTGPTPKKGEVKGNNNQNGKGNNDKEKTNPKEQAQQKAKEQAATTAMTALGVPAPVAKALSKPVANKLDQKGLLNDNQKIKQGQERLNNIRNATRSNEENTEEEEEETSPIDEIENVEAKVNQAKGIIRILKRIPPPAWGIIVGIVAFILIMLILMSWYATVAGAFDMNEDSEQIASGTSNIDDTSNTNPGTGELGYPTTSHTISAGYPYYSNGDFHGGIDFPVAVGTSVYAAEDGEVIIRKELNYSYGYYLYIKHDNGLCTLYAHNSELLVQQGDRVTKGQEIAKSGTTGNSTGPHVHFEVRTNCGVSSSGAPSGEYADPNNYLAE